MIKLTDLEHRRTDHAARVGRVNREGWMREASGPTGGGRTQRMPSAVGRVRRHVGDVLVGAGERLRGAPAGRAADPAPAARYALDAGR